MQTPTRSQQYIDYLPHLYLAIADQNTGDLAKARAQLGVAALSEAGGRRPNQKQARMYGMWLIDYYPYFHIARSHVRLQNWDCAKNALEISSRLGEIPNGTPEMAEYLSMQRETEQKLSKK